MIVLEPSPARYESKPCVQVARVIRDVIGGPCGLCGRRGLHLHVTPFTSSSLVECWLNQVALRLPAVHVPRSRFDLGLAASFPPDFSLALVLGTWLRLLSALFRLYVFVLVEKPAYQGHPARIWFASNLTLYTQDRPIGESPLSIAARYQYAASHLT